MRAPNMQNAECENSGNVDRAVDGAVELYQPPRPGSPEEQLERDMREIAARIRGKDGKPPSRAFYDIAGNEQHPFRIITRRVQEAEAARVPAEEIEAVGAAFQRYIQAKVARRQGRRSA